MGKVTIKQQSMPHVAGRTINLPIVGKVTFDSECQISVSEEDAQKLISLDFGFVSVGGKVKAIQTPAPEILPSGDQGEDIGKKSEEDDISKTDEDEDLEQPQANPSELIESLNTLAELREIAQDAGYDQSEWSSIKSKAKFKEYLKSKLA